MQVKKGDDEVSGVSTLLPHATSQILSIDYKLFDFLLLNKRIQSSKYLRIIADKVPRHGFLVVAYLEQFLVFAACIDFLLCP